MPYATFNNVGTFPTVQMEALRYTNDYSTGHHQSSRGSVRFAVEWCFVRWSINWTYSTTVCPMVFEFIMEEEDFISSLPIRMSYEQTIFSWWIFNSLDKNLFSLMITTKNIWMIIIPSLSKLSIWITTRYVITNKTTIFMTPPMRWRMYHRFPVYSAKRTKKNHPKILPQGIPTNFHPLILSRLCHW